MSSNHTQFCLTAGSEFIGQVCPVKRTLLRPGTWVVLCKQKRTVISLDAWKESISAWDRICPNCGCTAPLDPPPEPQKTRHIQPGVKPRSTRPKTQLSPSKARPKPRTRPVMHSTSPATINSQASSRSYVPIKAIGIGLVILVIVAISINWLFTFEIFASKALENNKQRPQSYFVRPTPNLEVKVNQELLIETRHQGQSNLDTLEIFINKQPVSAFPKNLAALQVLINGEVVSTLPLKAQFPVKQWNVSIIWIGHIPGTYELSLLVTDEIGRKGEPLIQRIEVAQN